VKLKHYVLGTCLEYILYIE